MKRLMADLREEWPRRVNLGVDGITADLQTGVTSRAYAALAVGQAGAPASVRTSCIEGGILPNDVF